ncbi:hypothetical protein H0E87_031327, partial [Populus deltoides]
MEVFVSFVAEEEDPSILDMARDVETLIHHVVRSVALLVIQLQIVLIAMQSLLTLPMLLKLPIPALHLTLQPIAIPTAKRQNSPSSSIAPSISSCVPCTTDLADDFVQHLSSEPTATGVSLDETVASLAVTEATSVASLPSH